MDKGVVMESVRSVPSLLVNPGASSGWQAAQFNVGPLHSCDKQEERHKFECCEKGDVLCCAHVTRSHTGKRRKCMHQLIISNQ